MLSKIKFKGDKFPDVSIIPYDFKHILYYSDNGIVKPYLNFSEYYNYTLYFCESNKIIYGKEEHYANKDDFNYFISYLNKKTNTIDFTYEDKQIIPFIYNDKITYKQIESFEQNSVEIKKDIYKYVLDSLNNYEPKTIFGNKQNYYKKSYYYNESNNNYYDDNEDDNEDDYYDYDNNYYKSLNNFYPKFNFYNNNNNKSQTKSLFLGIGGEFYFYWCITNNKYDEYIGITNNEYIYNDSKSNSKIYNIKSKNYIINYKNNALNKVIYYDILANIYKYDDNFNYNLLMAKKHINYKIDVVVNLFKIYDNVFKNINLLAKLNLINKLIIISCKDFDLNKLKLKTSSNIIKHDIKYFISDTTTVKIYVFEFNNAV